MVERDLDRRPTLVTVIRQGDPLPAIALVVEHVGSVEDSLRLATLLSSRLSGNTPTVDVVARLGAVSIVASIRAHESLQNVISRIDEAVRTKVRPEEVATPKFAQDLRKLRRGAATQDLLAQRWCLGDVTDRIRTLSDVDAVRETAFTQNRARWSAVGAPAFVNAVEQAILALEPWPNAPIGTNSWPQRDSASFVSRHDEHPKLTVLWRAPAAPLAASAIRDLFGVSGRLVDVLSAIPGRIQVLHRSSTPLAQGACNAISFAPLDNDRPMTPAELTSVARIAVVAIRQQQAFPPSPDDSTPLSTMEEVDPRRAAELAASLALSRTARNLPTRVRIEADLGVDSAADEPSPAQQDALASVVKIRHVAAVVPLVRTTERGQGRLHALVATPCATWSETSKSVGGTALLLRTLALSSGGEPGISIEPWVTPSGAGLVASARRVSAIERPETQARRLGDALGRALVASRIQSADLWQARSELLARVGPGPRPALWRAIIAIAPQHPGLVAPEGTFSSVAAETAEALQEHRMRLLRLPLRLAVVENTGAPQGEATRQALSRWLGLLANDRAKCPTDLARAPSESEEIAIESSRPDASDATTTVSMVLPGAEEGTDEAHAALLLWLLTRPSGWLELRLREANVVATTDARIVGGQERRGLVIVFGTLESDVESTVSLVRRMLKELGESRLASSTEVRLGIEHLTRADELRRADPRARLEDLWLSRKWPKKLSAATFRDYLHRTFRAPKVTIVHSRQSIADTKSVTRVKR